MSAQNKNTDAKPRTGLIEELKAEAASAAKESGAALASFAWLWPLRGVLYTATHPHVLLAVRGPLLKALGASAALFLALAFFTYLPQAALLSLFTGPLGPLLALALLGAESLALLTLLAKPLLLAPALERVFDTTLAASGARTLVAHGKTTRAAAAGSTLLRPLQALSGEGIVRYLLTLPLNAVPVLGTAAFLALNGRAAGPGWHARYFALKGFDAPARRGFVARHRPEYTAFGVAALLFNFVPVVGLVFTFTNTVGAALWAARLEAEANVIDPRPETAGETETAKTQ
ncbi:EI24 domain-containing protein [Phanerochaete sordida]|uniref:EI24 domain-containing protein n=1 Tax=Phanerochaete sordida TaxID=48140 RepID=A0A9P3GFG9_9APHY|nr:EI24 domain-containing protein [Phanerochaete sordida]